MKDPDFCVEEAEISALLAWHRVRKYSVKAVRAGSFRRFKDGRFASLLETVNYAFLAGGEAAAAEYLAYCEDPANRQDNPDRSPAQYEKLRETLLRDGYDPRKGVIVTDQHGVVLGGVHRACILLYAYGEAYRIPVLRLSCRVREYTWLQRTLYEIRHFLHRIAGRDLVRRPADAAADGREKP